MKCATILRRKYNNFKFQILKQSTHWIRKQEKPTKFGVAYLYFVIMLLANFSKIILFLLILAAILLYKALV